MLDGVITYYIDKANKPQDDSGSNRSTVDDNQRAAAVANTKITPPLCKLISS